VHANIWCDLRGELKKSLLHEPTVADLAPCVPEAGDLCPEETSTPR
jgi:hypothetical protein